MSRFFSFFLLTSILLLTGNCGKKSILDNAGTTVNQVLKEANLACNFSSPEESLRWLGEIIRKAEEDRLTKQHMGNYMGKITLMTYQNQPVIYIQMALGSGGIFAYIYDCTGNSVSISESDLEDFLKQAQSGKLIYSNLP